MVKEKVRNELYVCGNIDKQSGGKKNMLNKQMNERTNVIAGDELMRLSRVFIK